jgi:hypothetical protein
LFVLWERGVRGGERRGEERRSGSAKRKGGVEGGWGLSHVQLVLV